MASVGRASPRPTVQRTRVRLNFFVSSGRGMKRDRSVNRQRVDLAVSHGSIVPLEKFVDIAPLRITSEAVC